MNDQPFVFSPIIDSDSGTIISKDAPKNRKRVEYFDQIFGYHKEIWLTIFGFILLICTLMNIINKRRFNIKSENISKYFWLIFRDIIRQANTLPPEFRNIFLFLSFSFMFVVIYIFCTIGTNITVIQDDNFKSVRDFMDNKLKVGIMKNDYIEYGINLRFDHEYEYIKANIEKKTVGSWLAAKNADPNVHERMLLNRSLAFFTTGKYAKVFLSIFCDPNRYKLFRSKKKHLSVNLALPFSKCSSQEVRRVSFN